jgi:hypothetical protein
MSEAAAFEGERGSEMEKEFNIIVLVCVCVSSQANPGGEGWNKRGLET